MKSIAKSLAPTLTEAPSQDDPRVELKLLVREHRALTKGSVRFKLMSQDTITTPTGETVPNSLPLQARELIEANAKDLKTRADKLEPRMLAELRKFDIYKLFLKDVYGCGTITAAYLVALIDVRKCEKPSQLRRYCGMAVIDGRLERRQAGGGSTFNDKLRTVLYTMFSSMYRTGSGKRAKYLDNWHSVVEFRKLGGRDKGAHKAGWHKSCDLFLYDLYLIWRSIEGLPVWTTYYDWARGYEHGVGPLPRENAPRMLTVPEALDLVGYVGKVLQDAAE